MARAPRYILSGDLPNCGRMLRRDTCRRYHPFQDPPASFPAPLALSRAAPCRRRRRVEADELLHRRGEPLAQFGGFDANDPHAKSPNYSRCGANALRSAIVLGIGLRPRAQSIGEGDVW
jgi:hypothetical protein